MNTYILESRIDSVFNSNKAEDIKMTMLHLLNQYKDDKNIKLILACYLVDQFSYRYITAFDLNMDLSNLKYDDIRFITVMAITSILDLPFSKAEKKVINDKICGVLDMKKSTFYRKCLIHSLTMFKLAIQENNNQKVRTK